MLLESSYARPRFTGLVGAADALGLAQWAGRGEPLVVIAASALEAQRLREEIGFFNPALRVHLLPDWETLPYDHFSPHQDLISERLATLHHLRSRACDVLIAPVTTALYPLPPVAYLAAYTFFLKRGEKLNVPALREQLTLAGYSHVQQVLSPGEFCVRGGIIDLFAMGSVLPYRIDLFDDEIDKLAAFDVDSQRTLYPVPEIRLLPAREFPLDEAGQARFRQNFREQFEGDPSRSPLYKSVSKGIAPAGIEYYLPLFFEHTATLFDYLPPQARVCLHHDVAAAIRQFSQEAESRYRLLRGDPQRPLLPPATLFLGEEDFYQRLQAFERMDLLPPGHESVNSTACATTPVPNIAVNRRADVPTQLFADFLSNFNGRVLLLADSLGRREMLAGYLQGYGLKAKVCDNYADFLSSRSKLMLAIAPLHAGFVLPQAGLALVTEAELYAQPNLVRSRRTGKKTNVEGLLRDLSELKIDDPVVHEQHGIARYGGLITLNLGEGETEFLLLEYAGGDKLYVPVAQLHLVSRYSGGAADSAPLHRLGNGAWDKSKRRAMQQARDTAAELLNLYAQRALRKGEVCKLSAHDYEAFADGFGFEETPDQLAAIEAVLRDLQSGKPMDRLVCGDVGFGKTEVALRAAFIAAMDGKQVALLVPTTLLAEQHFQNFSSRFAEFPVRVGELSRFRSGKEQTQALRDLAKGKLDIIIGTHKLLQKDVQFHNLGLVIVDEEHRFGVQQKERLKSLRAAVHILTLTATPIPRTLAMSLEGLRDFSVIATAPQRRLSIKTFVAQNSDGIIREAVLRELKRGGQVYYLHNEVETIHNALEKLEKLLPEARIRIAHGQMGERELESVMRDFYQQRFNVLLCTTIIETGIDVPTANTIVMARADRFGLAQLHQLRGRVGRSHHQAYAYLLVETEALTAQAKKRLEAIQSMEQLGSGFYLAMHDLEIRGAGEVLGESQSGEMLEVGFALYNDMLNAAVSSLRQGHEPDMAHPLGVTTEINLHAPALLPNDYCGDTHQRLMLYKRLANCTEEADIDDLQRELIDRFGLPPDATHTLLDSHRLRIAAKPLGVLKVDASADNILVQFVPNPPIDPMRILKMIQTRRHYKLQGQDKLRIEQRNAEVAQRVAAVKAFFRELAG